MGQLDGNELIYEEMKTECGLLSMHLPGNGISEESTEHGIPSISRLLELKKDMKDVFAKIQKKQAILEEELRDIQVKYKEWLSKDLDTSVSMDESEEAVKKVGKINVNDNIVSRRSQLPSEPIQTKDDSKEKFMLSETYCESLKEINESTELQGLPEVPFSEKKNIYDDILHISDPEELKQRLGVSYFPTVDLSDKLPGDPVNEDFSKIKAPIQVSISTYYAYLEPFYRPFSEEDIAFLKEKGDELTTYMIPPLGIFSENVWSSEDPSNIASSGFNAISSVPYGSPSQLTDEHLYTEEISCGPLLERLLCAILKEENVSDDEQKTDDNEKDSDLSNSGSKIPIIKADYHTLEERLKRELRYIGILGEKEIDWNNREDDEISSNLRSLQSQLRRQCAINSARKNKLIKLIKEHLAYQEYSVILNDLNKQLEQAFLRRFKSIEAKKKKTIGNANSTDSGSGKIGLSNHIHALMQRRKKWIEKVGSIFTPIEKYTRLPTDTIYDDFDNVNTDEIIDEIEI
ncbi:unnamed protein product [Pneumocystis jirovecii]|uniref:Uncharacterized protein n=1 Tax=Pneumocystis jirovecii TaxID=42068 RepID=L0PDA1_PNEJI|nr:unnamed protein product [Pneumocystis jirovecii]